MGILIKGGNYLEGLNDLDTIVLDKTGTITKGTFNVTNVYSYNGLTREKVIELAAYGESYSNHPIGTSIMEAYGKKIDKNRIRNYREISGKGIKAEIDGEEILIGNSKLFKDNNIDVIKPESIGTVVYVGKDGVLVGTILVSDELKENVSKEIHDIKAQGIKNTIMLSGDSEEIAKKLGN